MLDAGTDLQDLTGAVEAGRVRQSGLDRISPGTHVCVRGIYPRRVNSHDDLIWPGLELGNLLQF